MHLTEFISLKDWSDSAVNFSIAAVYRMFSWGVEQGLLPNNPMRGIKRRKVSGRGNSVLITEEEHEKLLAVARGEDKRTLLALYETGCRPSELRAVRKEHYDEQLAA